MSRSRKKTPVIKDKTFRKEYNRVFRRINKIRLNQGKYLLHMYEVVNQYDVCEWRYYHPSDIKFYRK